jgi:hypothetical protein
VDKKTTGNCTLDYLIKIGQPRTVENYIRLDTMGDYSTLSELGPEDRAEVERLIREELLSVITPGSEMVQ